MPPDLRSVPLHCPRNDAAKDRFHGARALSLSCVWGLGPDRLSKCLLRMCQPDPQDQHQENAPDQPGNENYPPQPGSKNNLTLPCLFGRISGLIGFAFVVLDHWTGPLRLYDARPSPRSAHRNPGTHPGSLVDAELHRDGVGGLEPDATDVARQAIGVLRHHLHGIAAVGLVDAHRPRRADTMAVQEDHDLADCLLLGPGGRDAAGSHRADAVHLPQAIRLRLDDVKHLVAEGTQELFGIDRADAADHSRGEILLDALGRRGRRGLEEPGFELLTVGRSLIQLPEAVIHSPAEIAAAWPTKVTSSRWPRALIRTTQKPFSAFW